MKSGCCFIIVEGCSAYSKLQTQLNNDHPCIGLTGILFDLGNCISFVNLSPVGGESHQSSSMRISTFHCILYLFCNFFCVSKYQLRRHIKRPYQAQNLPLPLLPPFRLFLWCHKVSPPLLIGTVRTGAVVRFIALKAN